MKSAVSTFGIVAASFLIAGCATTFGSRAQEVPGLKAQVASLEARVGELNQQIAELQKRQGDLEGQWTSRQTPSPLEAQPKKARSLSTREIQLALKSAGFYAGSIDGKLGPQTKQALKTFQRSQGLSPDGVVGQKTSSALDRFLPETTE